MLLRRRGVREEGNERERGKREGEGTLKYERRLNAGGQAGRKARREREKERACVYLFVSVSAYGGEKEWEAGKEKRSVEKENGRKKEQKGDKWGDDAMRNRRAFAERERAWIKRARRKSARV